MSTNDLIAGRIKVIDDLLKEIADERRKASMKGKRNVPQRLIANIMIKGHNEDIIKEACKIIEILTEENKGLSEIIDHIQSQPPP